MLQTPRGVSLCGPVLYPFEKRPIRIVWNWSPLCDTCWIMVTSSDGIIFRVTGHLCGEFTGEFPTQSPVTRSFDVFFDLRPNKQLSKQSWGWWFETPSRPLWRHCNDMLLLMHIWRMYTVRAFCLYFCYQSVLPMPFRVNSLTSEAMRSYDCRFLWFHCTRDVILKNMDKWITLTHNEYAVVGIIITEWIITKPCVYLVAPILLAWFAFNPIMDK